jgi:hypothetical protein
MATASFVVPNFIQEDFFTQNLVDDLHHLERQRAQAQDAYQHHATDDIAALLQHYSLELEELAFIIRDRLWALNFGRGQEVDDARVQHFFDALTVQAQNQPVDAGDHAGDLDEATIAALAAAEYEPDGVQGVPTSGPGRADSQANVNPRDTPVLLTGVIPPRVAARAPAAFRVAVPEFLLPG